MPALADAREQAVTGVTAPQTKEAIIRDVWQSLTAHSGAANLARACYRSVVLAPIGWLIMAPFFLLRLLAPLPGLSRVATRFRLTNQRLMICKGMRPIADKEIPLHRIRDVRLRTDANGDFYFCGTLEIIDDAGKTAMTLTGVREPESVRHSILQAVAAWGGILNANTTVQ